MPESSSADEREDEHRLFEVDRDRIMPRFFKETDCCIACGPLELDEHDRLQVGRATGTSCILATGMVKYLCLL